MRKVLVNILFILSLPFFLISQNNNIVKIEEMKWGADFNIHIKFSNDSSSIYDIQALHHSSSENSFSTSQATYYPVNLDSEFIGSLKNKKLESFIDDSTNTKKKSETIKHNTLWSTIHYDIGGGWIHFINCLVYSLESGNLNLTSPLMQRPVSNWKPSPITESYKRTKKWEYYVPMQQKLALKEYKIKEKNNQLGDIAYLPHQFIELFKNTTDKDYELLKKEEKNHELAIIDMVKLLLGSNYLGPEQISYISNAVTKAVLKYNANNLPSVIIFDDFEAAVAMTLNSNGYQIEKIVFNNEEELKQEAIDQRVERMEGIINKINEVNKKVFERKLKNYYTE